MASSDSDKSRLDDAARAGWLYFIAGNTQDEIARKLTPENHNLAVQLATIPEQIRGFGHVKEKNLARAKANESALLETFRSKPGRFASAAE